MQCHIFILFFHSITFTAGSMTVTTSFLFPDNDDVAVWDIAKLLMFFTQSISQAVLMYLVWQLNTKK